MNKEMIKKAIDSQAKDRSLWFIAEYCTEAYLQKSLRLLHRVIEDNDSAALDAIIKQSKDHNE